LTSVEYVTHASLCFRHDGRSLLTDPFYWFDPLAASVMQHYPPRRLEPSDLGRIDFLYSSHIHPDHSHPDTLARLRPQVQTVLLPAQRPGLWQRYEGLGFTDVRRLQNGQTEKLSDALEVTSYWSDPVDTCLVVDMGGTVALHCNDCLPTPELASRIGDRHPIDTAFMLYTSAQDLYPFLLPRPHVELARLAGLREQAFLHDQIERVRRLRPRRVVPYSMTMTWFQPEQRWLNGCHRLLPAQFAEAVEKAVPGTVCEVVQPGDVVERDGVRQAIQVDYWGRTLEEYLANIERHCSGPPFQPGRVGDVLERLQSSLQRFVAGIPGFTDLYAFLRRGVGLTVEGVDGPATFFLDLATRRVQQGEGWPVLEVAVPASIVASMLDGHYDPYSLLFLHRARFKLNSLQRLTPEAESNLYLVTFMLILCDNPGDFVSSATVALPA
jgi:UDP-MurNAc hydroxylase